MTRGRAQCGQPHIGGSSFNGRRNGSTNGCRDWKHRQKGSQRVIPHQGRTLHTNPNCLKSVKFFSFSDHTLVIHSIDSHLFTFSQDHSSGIVDSSRIRFSVKRNSDNHILSPEERAAIGCKGFSLKLVLIPKSELLCKFTLVLLPWSKTELLEKSRTRKTPSFRG